MLEIRAYCELCEKLLSNGSPEAMICSFECTFCQNCVEQILENVCPNCGGGFERRPTRPRNKLEQYPINNEKIVRSLDQEKLILLKEKFKLILPNDR